MLRCHQYPTKISLHPRDCIKKSTICQEGVLISKRSESISWFHWQFCIGWGSPLRIPTTDDHATLQWKQLFLHWRFPHYWDFHTTEISTLQRFPHSTERLRFPHYCEVREHQLVPTGIASVWNTGHWATIMQRTWVKINDGHVTQLGDDQWMMVLQHRWVFLPVT